MATNEEYNPYRNEGHLPIEWLCTELLKSIGENPNRQGLQGTPKRWARWWTEFIEYDPGHTDVSFQSIVTDQMVVVTGVRVWSLCEHHLLPFWCDISMAYITRSKVLGLSKFARIAHRFAHQLQIQERLVHQVADRIAEVTESKDVAVVGNGVHLCMLMRGIKTEGKMITSVMRGAFFDNVTTRQEFLRIIELGQMGD